MRVMLLSMTTYTIELTSEEASDLDTVLMYGERYMRENRGGQKLTATTASGAYDQQTTFSANLRASLPA